MPKKIKVEILIDNTQYWFYSMDHPELPEDAYLVADSNSSDGTSWLVVKNPKLNTYQSIKERLL